MRQLRVEFARFRSRRAVVLLVLLGALLAAGLAGQIAWDTRPATRAEVATAQAQASLEAESDEVVATISDCEKDPSVYLPPGSTRADCTKLLAPTADSMLERSPIDLAKVLQGRTKNNRIVFFSGPEGLEGTLVDVRITEPRPWTLRGELVSVPAGV